MTYERTIRVAAKPARVWRAFTEPEALRAWHGHAEVFELRPGGRVLFRNPGWDDVEGVIEEVRLMQHLRWRVLTDGSEIDERFASTNEGTTIVIIHRSSPGDERWQEGLAALTLGWNESIADLVLYLDHGIEWPRHMAERASFGAKVRDTAAGVEITDVAEDGFAGRAGLHSGDLLLQIGAAPLFDRTDLALLLREHRPGSVWQLTYARKGRIERVTATL